MTVKAVAPTRNWNQLNKRPLTVQLRIVARQPKRSECRRVEMPLRASISPSVSPIATFRRRPNTLASLEPFFKLHTTFICRKNGIIKFELRFIVRLPSVGGALRWSSNPNEYIIIVRHHHSMMLRSDSLATVINGTIKRSIANENREPMPFNLSWSLTQFNPKPFESIRCSLVHFGWRTLNVFITSFRRSFRSRAQYIKILSFK